MGKFTSHHKDPVWTALVEGTVIEALQVRYGAAKGRVKESFD